MLSKVEKKDFENYLKEARSWETDRVQELLKSRKTAWTVASGAALVSLVAVFAVAALSPLKTVEPYVIRVDNATGIVDVAKPMGDGKSNYDEAMNKYFTQWYVRYREGYSKELAADYYGNVGLMSGGTEQQKYYEFFTPANPQSPLNIYGDAAKLKVQIKSVSFLKSNIALVRYTKELERGTDKALVSHWAATLVFKYSGAPMTEKDRSVNPLGFQVIEYRTDPDAVPVEAGAPVSKP